MWPFGETLKAHVMFLKGEYTTVHIRVTRPKKDEDAEVVKRYLLHQFGNVQHSGYKLISEVEIQEKFIWVTGACVFEDDRSPDAALAHVRDQLSGMQDGLNNHLKMGIEWMRTRVH